ncbi:hypothetical protein K8R47_01390 [archaeon]|nr:hypothetical protein [archaeon]
MNKGQTKTGTNVGFLIFLIALFIVLYILLLPPEDRNQLLNQTSDENGNGGNGPVTDSDVLLLQNPGTLKVLEDETEIHEIDAVNLYIRNEPVVNDLATSVYVRKSLFGEDVRNLVFNVEDIDNLDNVKLFFTILEGQGNLIVNINGVDVYNSKAVGLTQVILPVDLLNEDDNILRISVSSPGFNLFGRNYYSLQNIKLRESYELTNTKESRSFVLTKEEVNDGTLSYLLYCNKADLGARLRLFLNGEEISSEVVACASAEKNIDIDEEDLEEGRNELLFEVDRGDFLINDIKLEVDIEGEGERTYKFSMSDDQYDDVLFEKKDAVIFLIFGDDEDKKADISVNGHEFTLDTKDLEYDFVISDYVREGNNFLRISPMKEFIIDELEIRLE